MSSVPECQGCGDYVYFGHCLCSECSDKLQTQLAEAIQAKGECVAGLIKETQKVMELTKNLGEYPEVCRQLAEAKKKIERLKESGMTEELVACDQALCDANSDNVQLTALLAEVRQGLEPFNLSEFLVGWQDNEKILMSDTYDIICEVKDIRKVESLIAEIDKALGKEQA